MTTGKLAAAALLNVLVGSWPLRTLATISSVLALATPVSAQELKSTGQSAKDLRDEAARIIPFESAVVISMHDWDRQINVVRAVSALASYQFTCTSIGYHLCRRRCRCSESNLRSRATHLQSQFQGRKSVRFVGIFRSALTFMPKSSSGINHNQKCEIIYSNHRLSLTLA